MLTHYFTLSTLSRELNGLLKNAVVTEVFSQQKDELIVVFDQQMFSLIISVNPKLNYIFLRGVYSRAKKNSVDLFPAICECSVSQVSILPNDRVLIMNLSNNAALWFQLYNTASSNILLVGKNGIIDEAFKRNKNLKGKPVTKETSPSLEEQLNDPQILLKQIEQFSDETIYKAVKEMFPHLGSTYAREVLHRVELPENRRVHELHQSDIEQIITTVKNIVEESRTYQPTIYYRDNVPRVLSVIPLHYLGGAQTQLFLTVNEAVQRFVAQYFRTENIEQEKNYFFTKLKSLNEHTLKAIDKTQQQVTEADKPKEYKHIADTIMANLQHLTKGTKQVEVPDIYNPDRVFTLVLNPKLTPAENAEEYYAKAKKAKTALKEAEQRLKELTERKALLAKMLLHLDHCQTSEQLAEFKITYQQELNRLRIAVPKEERVSLPFREFTVVGGYKVWVGKSGASNDVLTMQYAKPNDIWLHVRGASGSHTVLKNSSGKQPIPKNAIEQAAKIAAYYSKMRNSNTVPVAYCERKYIRKPKGTPEGTVVMEREEIIFVTPGLP